MLNTLNLIYNFMFYIIEIITRLKYFIFSYCFLLIVCYFYYDIFFTILDLLFKNILNNQNDNIPNYYIYTHPFELYYTHLIFCFILSLHIILPYIIWQLIDFNKTSLYKSEYIFIFKLSIKILFFFLSSYLLLYGFIIPYFLEILQIAKQTYNSTFFTVFFELKVQDFINFILYLNSIFTILIFFLILLSIIILNLTLKKIISLKKLIYLISIIFSTFLSPPDIASQLLLLCIIICSIEFIIFFKIINFYFSNNYGKEFVDNIKKNTANK